MNKKFPGALARHRLRHTPSGYRYALADSIRFLSAADWNAVTENASVFTGHNYLAMLESCGMADTGFRYALVYDADAKPVAAVAAQLYHWRAEKLAENERQEGRFRKALAEAGRNALNGFGQRLLVCGNLVSSGLHGVAFAPGEDQVALWPAVAEALYRIRRAEKLSGETDFLLIKDFKGADQSAADALRIYSYRPIRGEPDMVLTLPEDCVDFDAYLALLNTKYRGKLKRIRKQIDEAGFEVMPIADLAAADAALHALYSQVERKASVRLAALPLGYFGALAETLGPDRIRFTGLRLDGRFAGFISTIRENDGSAIAYYVGMDYAVNEKYPVYLRLLQSVIEDALAMGCRKISFGRTAAEPKATLGAKPVDTFVWARHRLPAVNWFLRQLFPALPYEDAPERSPFKEK